MRFQSKYFGTDVYSEEGFLDPLKNVFNKIGDKFNKDINFYNDINSVEKQMRKTYLDDNWIERRKWVKPNSTIVVQMGSLLNPQTHDIIFEKKKDAFNEAKDFVRFFEAEYHSEKEFLIWLLQNGWVKQPRAINKFLHNLKQSYGEQSIAQFKGKDKLISYSTEIVSPVLDNALFKHNALEVLELSKYIGVANSELYKSILLSHLYRWNTNVYDALKSQIKADFTSEYEVFDQNTNTTTIVKEIKNEDLYIEVMDCLRSFNDFTLSVNVQFSGKLIMPVLQNTRHLRNAMYNQLRQSFTA